MLNLKKHLPGFLSLRGTVGLLIAALALPGLLLSQVAEGNGAGTWTVCSMGLAVANALQNDQAGSMAEYQKMLQTNPRSSLANYRIADLLLNQRNYQASANCYRDALKGDGDPSWTRVWSHLQLGKIFDITNQRDRAVKGVQAGIADQRQHPWRSYRGGAIAARAL